MRLLAAALAYPDAGVRPNISTFALLPATVIEPAMQRLERDVADGTWADRNAELLTSDEHDFGYRLLIAELRLTTSHHPPMIAQAHDPPQRELKTMALADELAYMTATEMAARIRRRQLSPVEIVDAVIERIEERNPSINAFIFKGYDDARKRAEQAEHAVMSRRARSGPLHGVPTAMKDLLRLQARLARDVRRRARPQGSRDRRLLRVRRARGARPARS